MAERLDDNRVLCSDLIDLHWVDKRGKSHKAVANLEDISNSGACIQTERPLPHGTPVRIALPTRDLIAKVRYCVYREIGYFLGITFIGCRWSRATYTPNHMLDPRKMLPESGLAESCLN